MRGVEGVVVLAVGRRVRGDMSRTSVSFWNGNLGIGVVASAKAQLVRSSNSARVIGSAVPSAGVPPSTDDCDDTSQSSA